MSYDIVIRNGRVIDGSGAPGYVSDVAIKDGKIAAFGRIRDNGAKTIDAEGLAVTPGFIDGHTHMDAQVFWDPLGTGSCWHGVTSVVMGNCGFTLAPCRPGDADYIMHSLEAVEDISADVMKAGVDWTWGSYRDYLERLDRLPKGINYGGYVGHSALRRYVMGERASTHAATGGDVEAMRAELQDALEAGSLGFSTSRSTAHLTPDREPVPSRLAEWSEVESLVRLMGDLNAGIFEIARGREPDEYDRLRDLAVETRRPIMFGAAANRRDPGGTARLLAGLDEAAALGGTMIGQAHSRAIATLWSFKTHVPYDSLPGWSELRARPLAEQKALLSDPETKRHLVEIASNPPPPARPRAGGEQSIPTGDGYNYVRVMLDPVGPNPTLAELAASSGKHPAEIVIDYALERDLDVYFCQELTFADDEVLKELIDHPQTVVTFSDSGAHVSQIVDCSLQSHFLAYWVRKKQALSLETAVRNLTFDLARAWGIPDRGLLRVGAAADVIVFDPETVGPVMPEVARDLPAGGLRVTQRAQGFKATVVNGVLTLRDGDKPTGDFAGQLIRGPLAAAK